MIMIKPEFDQKLKDLGVKDQFIENLKEQKGFMKASLNTAPSFAAFVAMAFLWHTTLEGHDFWKDVAFEKKPEKP